MASTLVAPAPVPVATEDLLVVDARAPRFNQATVALLATAALVTGAWPLLTLLAVQLTVSVVFGRRYCLPCVFYFKVVQPRFGAGPLEDSRAPRFANLIGAGVLWSATLAYAVGLRDVGFGLGAMVAVLASLATTTGLCVGCELYRLLAKARGITGGSFERIDLEQLGGASPAAHETVVLFTHPLCSDCHDKTDQLRRGSTPVVTVDVSKQRAVAKKYGVSVVPLAFRVDGQGRVLGTV